ncbi:MAG: hypothetical protein JKY48_09245 [Flavobacteriales bacterium]|nr:hypothetical protein [Flavobacteriales bacterium]
MKLLTHKAGLLATLIFFLLSNTISAKKGGVEKTRNINETYTVSANHKIEINNKFGEVKINSWDKSEVAVKINISVKDGNEKRAQNLLDRIKIDIKNTANQLTIRTIIDGNNKNLKIKAKGDEHLSIDFEISVPANNLLSVKNSFGPVIIDKMTNNVMLDLKFGGATIGDLNGDQNSLKFEFADPVVINSMKGGNINLKFSKLEMINSQNVVLASEMSSSKFEMVKKGQFNLKFGSLDIGELQELILNSQMSAVKIGSIHIKANIKNKYGSLKISKILKSLESIEIDAEFSPIKLLFEKEGSYQIDAHSKMAGLKLPPNSIQEEKVYKESNSIINNEKEFKGRIGTKKGNPSKVKIQSSFGEVKLMLTD